MDNVVREKYTMYTIHDYKTKNENTIHDYNKTILIMPSKGHFFQKFIKIHIKISIKMLLLSLTHPISIYNRLRTFKTKNKKYHFSYLHQQIVSGNITLEIKLTSFSYLHPRPKQCKKCLIEKVDRREKPFCGNFTLEY